MHDITQLWGMCIIGKEEEEDSYILYSLHIAYHYDIFQAL